MSFRIEEKIPVTPSQTISALSAIVAKGAKPLFPDRLISSCYFDTRNYTLFNESEEGVLPRRKVRLRHYPESDQDTFSLETKISSVEGRFKFSEVMSGTAAIRAQTAGLIRQNYGMLKPAVWVTYRRSYYELQGIRLTFDREIVYKKTGAGSRSAHERSNVIELKAPHNTPRDMLLDLFEQSRQRFSKYSNAVKLLGLARF